MSASLSAHHGIYRETIVSLCLALFWLLRLHVKVLLPSQMGKASKSKEPDFELILFLKR